VNAQECSRRRPRVPSAQHRRRRRLRRTRRRNILATFAGPPSTRWPPKAEGVAVIVHGPRIVVVGTASGCCRRRRFVRAGIFAARRSSAEQRYLGSDEAAGARRSREGRGSAPAWRIDEGRARRFGAMSSFIMPGTDSQLFGIAIGRVSARRCLGRTKSTRARGARRERVRARAREPRARTDEGQEEDALRRRGDHRARRAAVALGDVLWRDPRYRVTEGERTRRENQRSLWLGAAEERDGDSDRARRQSHRAWLRSKEKDPRAAPGV